MADNLNLQNSSTDQPAAEAGDSTSLTPTPAKSPLEEAGVESTENPNLTPAADVQPQSQTPDLSEPVTPALSVDQAPTPAVDMKPEIPAAPAADSPIPSGAPDPMQMPDPVAHTSDTMMSSEPAAAPVAAPTDTPTAPASPATPPIDQEVNKPVEEAGTSQDMGEPSEAPDTDQFLQSILDSKSPASQEVAVSPEAPSVPEAPIETPPADVSQPSPAEPIETAASVAPEVPASPAPAAPAESPFSVPEPASNEPAPALSELATDLPPQASEPAPASTEPATMAASQNVAPDNVAPVPGIDSLTSTTSPMTDTPSQSPAADIFNKNQAPKKSPIKLILMILLIAAILGGVYYAAKTYFFSSNVKNSDNSGLETPTPSQSAVALSGDSARKADLKAIQQALLNLYSSNGTYPVSAEYIKLSQAGNVVENELVPNYLSKLPSDPDSTRAYQYKSDGSTFTLTAVLDNTSDPGVVMEGGIALYKIDQSTDVALAGGATNSATASATTSATTGSGGVSAATLTATATSESGTVSPDSSDLF